MGHAEVWKMRGFGKKKKKKCMQRKDKSANKEWKGKVLPRMAGGWGGKIHLWQGSEGRDGELLVLL